jgi:hypothetical protein
MSSIRETISNSLRSSGLSGYARQAEPIIVALEEREAGMSKQLIDFATENGLTSDQARDVLTGMGMEVPTDGGADPRIAAMEAQITAMQQTLRDLRG